MIRIGCFLNVVNKKFGGFLPNGQNQCTKAPHYTQFPDIIKFFILEVSLSLT